MSSKLHYEIRIKRGRVYTIRLDFCPRNVTRGELRRSPLLHLEIDFFSSLHLWKLSSRFIPNNGNIRVSGNIHATFITRLIERNIFFNRGKWKESFINSVIISRRFYLIILIEKVSVILSRVYTFLSVDGTDFPLFSTINHRKGSMDR